MATYLPTVDRITTRIPSDLDVASAAQSWLSAFASAVASNDASAILDTIHADGWWRDLFALTWDLRTFHGKDAIKTFLDERVVGQSDAVRFHVSADEGPIEAALAEQYADMRWVRVQFHFETKVAQGHGVAYVVPVGPAWKAFVLATHLSSLTRHPAPDRSFAPNHGKWEPGRQRAKAFLDADPEVIVVGAGHSGLDVGARLGVLGVKTLLVDKNEHVGDNWRWRYEALCLHDVIWANRLPYIEFPKTWPVFIPAKKMAGWLEYYAEAMELNVWTSTLVTNAVKDANTGKWLVTMETKNAVTGEAKQKVIKTDHVVFALGFGGGVANFPQFPGRDAFKGQVLHSSQHKSARDHQGKKVVIVGACTSAHDIASDYAEHGVDVTIFQRSSTYIMTTKEGMPRLMKPVYWEGGPPVEIADVLANTFPAKFSKLMWTRSAADIAAADKDLLDGLHRVGYKTNLGEEGSGFIWMALKRGGGYYLDVGACQKIIDGEIKIKNGTTVAAYTPSGLKFEDGSELQADVVMFATGYADPRDVLRPLLGPDVSARLPRLWGLNDEGELNGVWREIGTEGLWNMSGNFSWSRFFSQHVALQIKAQLAGEFGSRYSAPFVY